MRKYKYADEQSQSIAFTDDDGCEVIVPISMLYRDDMIDVKLAHESNNVEAYMTQADHEEEELNRKIKDAIKYIENTNWYTIQKYEHGIPIPEDVVVNRREALAFLNANNVSPVARF